VENLKDLEKVYNAILNLPNMEGPRNDWAWDWCAGDIDEMEATWQDDFTKLKSYISELENTVEFVLERGGDDIDSTIDTVKWIEYLPVYIEKLANDAAELGNVLSWASCETRRIEDKLQDLLKDFKPVAEAIKPVAEVVKPIIERIESENLNELEKFVHIVKGV
jgi:hypothetical protein